MNHENPIPILCFFLLALILPWVDFRSLNAVLADLEFRQLRSVKINPLERLFVKLFLRTNHTFDMSDISEFKVHYDETFTISLQKYFIDLITKGGRKVTLFGFKHEGDANAVAHFLFQIVRERL